MKDRISSLTVITASAGSGKTFRLALEFLSLLREENLTPAEALASIMAITFTNKAAAEMKERVLLFLKKIALGLDNGQLLGKLTGLKEKEASFWIDTILDNYSDFQIKTIDSLLFSILKALSFEMGINPEMQVEFSPREMVERGFEEIMTEGEASKELEDLINTYLSIEESSGFYPEQRIINRFCELFPFIHSPLRPYKVPFEEIVSLQNKLEESYKKFYTEAQNLKKYLNGNLFKNLSPDIPLSKLLERKFISLPPEKLFKKSAPLDKIFESHPKFFSLFQDLNFYAKKYIELQALSLYHSPSGYIPFFNQLKKKIEEIALREGVVFVHDWTEGINEILEKDLTIPLIFAYLGATIRHFLVDEFQDTSVAQWRALFPLFLESLSQGGSLFVVGDIKQAIYRWRGGDWRILQNITSYFENRVRKIYTEVLDKNYRSHPYLVEFFNSFFEPIEDEEWIKKKIAPIFLGKDESLMHAKFASSLKEAFAQYRQIPALRSMDDKVEVSFFKVEVLDDEGRLLLERHLVELIRDKWQNRKHKEESMAVLVRSNEQAKEVSAWLIKEGLPVLTENCLNLKISPLVRGVVCFLELLLDPELEYALYGVLKSGLFQPPCGPEDEGELATEWILKSPRFLKWREEVFSLRERIYSSRLIQRSPYEIIRFIMRETGIEDRKEEKEFIYRFLEVVHDFQVWRGPCLSDMVSFLYEKGLESQVEMPQQIEAIRVITIHKAKGLEFSAVFVPYTNWTLSNSSPVIVEDNTLVRLSKKTCVIEKAKEKFQTHRIMELQEMFNLFYVAITRATNCLYCYITPYRKKNSFAQVIELFMQKNPALSKFVSYI